MAKGESATITPKVNQKASESNETTELRKSVRTHRKGLGLTLELFAKIMGCSRRSLASFEGSSEVVPQIDRQVKEAIRLTGALSELLGDHLSRWLLEPNPGFDGRTPMELIEGGQSDLIWNMIHESQQMSYA